MNGTNAIKHYRSPVDEQGGYRMYSVYQKGSLFIFECWDCSLTDAGGSSVGSRKAYKEHQKLEDAVAEYEKYLEAWEPKE